MGTRWRALLVAGVLGGGMVLLPAGASAQETAPACGDYISQADAQAAFVVERVRLAALDPDRDGTACDEPAARLAAAPTGEPPATTTTSPTTSLTTTTAPATTGTTTAATAATAAQAAEFRALLDDVAALQCGSSFNADLGGLNDRFVALIPVLSSEEQGAYDDALAARDLTLNHCVPTTDDVVAGVDDGSVPITSGGQVSVVPEGSAETGEA